MARFAASAQLGSTHRKGNIAQINVWDLTAVDANPVDQQSHLLHVFQSITHEVYCVEFSPDERFLCACGKDASLYIWEVMSGEVVLSKRMHNPVSVFSWTSFVGEGRRASYEICYASGPEVAVANFAFDHTRMQWVFR
jgi:WD40 repeat protein